MFESSEWLVLYSDNGISYIKKVKPHWADLVLGLVAFGRSTIPDTYTGTHTYSPLGKKWQVLH